MQQNRLADMNDGEIVVLTGSSGCLGHRTLRLLISNDDKVREIRCVDLVDPDDWMRNATDEEIKKVAIEKTIKYIKGDIRDINVAEQALEGADCVIHCAAKIDVWTEPCEQDASELESINVFGTENLLKACVRLGVPKFVHVSSYETFVSYHTIYYATESTLPDPKFLLFGPSAESKKEAEQKVRQYANNKLKRVNPEKRSPSSGEARDSLNAVIIRFTPIYGERDKYFVTKILELAKSFSGKLKRFTNVWIRQQPIYVGNAAWALIKAKQRMDVDESISGEDFHITDDTKISDPFDFFELFAECQGVQVSKSSFPAWPIWFFLVFLSYIRGFLSTLGMFGLFTATKKRWYHLITPQMFYFTCNSLFLNRTKASLRLDYEPLFSAEDSLDRSLEWYTQPPQPKPKFTMVAGGERRPEE